MSRPSRYHAPFDAACRASQVSGAARRALQPAAATLVSAEIVQPAQPESEDQEAGDVEAVEQTDAVEEPAAETRNAVTRFEFSIGGRTLLKSNTGSSPGYAI